MHLNVDTKSRKQVVPRQFLALGRLNRFVAAMLSIQVASAAQRGVALPAQEPTPTVFAPGVISGPASDLSPAFTPDGRTVFFTRANSSQSTILVSHLSGGKWSKPVIAPFSGQWRDLEAAMAPDGSYLIFVSNRPALPGGKPVDGFYNGASQPGAGGNLWRVDHTARGWGEPHRLPDVVNANGSIFSPAVAADGSLYFMQPDGAVTQFHIYRSQFSNGSFETPVAVPVSANDTIGDFDPAIAPDESFMIFSSTRLPGAGTSLFIAFRTGKKWGTPTFMGNVVSPPRTNNIEARLGPDGRTLYFSSGRIVPTTPHDREATAKGLELMEAWNNGLANIWRIPLDTWLRTNQMPSSRVPIDAARHP